MTGDESKIVRGRSIDGTVYICGWSPEEPDSFILTLSIGEAQRMRQEWAEAVIDMLATRNLERAPDGQVGHLIILDAPPYVNSGDLVAIRGETPDSVLGMEWELGRARDLRHAVDIIAMMQVEHGLARSDDVTLYTDDGRALWLHNGEFRP